MGEVPILYGSRPPAEDSVWDRIRDDGFDVKVFDRNIRNKEKGVDMEMGMDIVERLHAVDDQLPRILAFYQILKMAENWPVVAIRQRHVAGWQPVRSEHFFDTAPHYLCPRFAKPASLHSPCVNLPGPVAPRSAGRPIRVLPSYLVKSTSLCSCSVPSQMT